MPSQTNRLTTIWRNRWRRWLPVNPRRAMQKPRKVQWWIPFMQSWLASNNKRPLKKLKQSLRLKPNFKKTLGYFLYFHIFSYVFLPFLSILVHFLWFLPFSGATLRPGSRSQSQGGRGRGAVHRSARANGHGTAEHSDRGGATDSRRSAESSFFEFFWCPYFDLLEIEDEVYWTDSFRLFKDPETIFETINQESLVPLPKLLRDHPSPYNKPLRCQEHHIWQRLFWNLIGGSKILINIV